MKKIMFNDRFGLTDAVLEGRKTVTRRIITPQPDDSGLHDHTRFPLSIDSDMKGLWGTVNDTGEHKEYKLPYQVSEVVAIAQRYEYIICGARFDNWEIKELQSSAGYTNKMFVKAELMPHRIEILDVRVERIQNITDEDCIKEGIVEIIPQYGHDYWYSYPNSKQAFGSPREAFASLIDKVDKKGTWESNPFVFRYEFKLK